LLRRRRERHAGEYRDERVLYLTESMGATRWQTFRYVRLPAAMTYIFAGL
jgi:NitT/TauT family transport system permease protein